jgi:hypothetical protein
MSSDFTSKKNEGDKPGVSRVKATVNVLAGLSYTHFPLILPGVYPLVAPLIMFRLKRRGFSNCRVTVSGSGIIVYADR